jgi:hypothetical protein
MDENIEKSIITPETVAPSMSYYGVSIFICSFPRLMKIPARA